MRWINTSERDWRHALIATVVAILLVTAWYASVVTFLYGGNWTALYCNGKDLTYPPDIIREGVLRGPSKGGYDGQFYHMVAHDPFLRTDYWKYMFLPRVRYQRILVPGLAWLMAFGRRDLIDPMFVEATIGFLALGVWWCARLCAAIGRNPYLGLLFLLLPGALITLDRFNADVPLCTFAAGFAYYSRIGAPRGLLSIAAAAPLARETGFVFPVALAIYYLTVRRWRPLVAAAASTIPALAWFAFVAGRTPKMEIANWHVTFPLGWAVGAIVTPMAYPATNTVFSAIRVLDRVALAGTLACFAIAMLPFRRWKDPVYFACLLFACAGLAIATVSSLDTWQDIFGYGRYVSPLILLVALRSVEAGRIAGFVPWMLLTARSGIPLASQFLMMLRGHSLVR